MTTQTPPPPTDQARDRAYEPPHTPGCEADTAEADRLSAGFAREANWQRWGTYLPDRQWGTVREDYSEDGSVWANFPFDQAHRRAFRWGEDGLFGWTDRECRLCFSLALWNGQDPILKERLFGLTGPQGNHGEDVKELYYYLDSSPSHSYAKVLYRYPQTEFPYEELRKKNAAAGFDRREVELLDTDALDGGRFFDVTVEYAKAGPDDTLIRVTVTNNGPKPAEIALLPQLLFRNTWSWACSDEGCSLKPRMSAAGKYKLQTDHEHLEPFVFEVDPKSLTRKAELLWCDNETNAELLFGQENTTPFPKDAFHRYVIDGEAEAVSPKGHGTKAAVLDKRRLRAGQSVELRARLVAKEQRPKGNLFGEKFDVVFEQRIAETERYYDAVISPRLDGHQRVVARQAYAGLLWTKKFYHYVVKTWLDGDPNEPPPPPHRGQIRNGDWRHLFNRDVISMPDAWEYPWYALWDLAFHMLPMAAVDPYYAKEQLVLFGREWYMHPNGQMPAYEWNFSDVNPPVHAWAVWRVYKLTAPKGERDKMFLARNFHKLLLNFTWWVNRKDVNGDHLFSGGFLGLDNIGVFDRSEGVPGGANLEQADGTAWMAFYCVTMLAISIELAVEQPEYEGVASKFFEHFVEIADAMNRFGGTGLWDEQDGFYYDHMRQDHEDDVVMRIRSMVGLVPLFAVLVLEDSAVDKLPNFKRRMEWFLQHRDDLSGQVSYLEEQDRNGRDSVRRLLAIPSEKRLRSMLKYVLDPEEFLSPFGIRSMSKYHEDNPFGMDIDGKRHEVRYLPAESDSGLFGGNSNWRGPIWLPMNFLLIESLERYYYFYKESFTIEYPTGSGEQHNLRDIAKDLARRLTLLFLPGEDGQRPCHGDEARYADDPAWKDLVLFYEYFDGDTGRGCGASHQTGWTALVTKLLENCST